MPYVDEGVINYRIYEDGTEFLGTASVTLPEIAFKSITVSGSGIAGDVDSPILGHMEAMTLTINWRSLERAAYHLSEMRDHMLDIRVAQQNKHSGSADMIVVPTKHIVVGRPKTLSPGEVKPASEMGTSLQLSLSYYATYIKNRKMTEIDPYNFVCIINGVDYLAETNRALGKA